MMFHKSQLSRNENFLVKYLEKHSIRFLFGSVVLLVLFLMLTASTLEDSPRRNYLLLGLLATGAIVADGYVRMTNKNRVQEETLNRSHLRFDLAVQGSGAGIYEWDLTTGIIQHNVFVDQMLGFDERELPDLTLQDFVDRLHPEDREMVSNSVSNHLKTGAPYAVKFRMRRKDNTYLWVSDSGLALRNDTGQPILWAGILINIDDQVKYQNTILAKNNELAKANSELDLLIYRITHDLKAPLSSIVGLAALCKLSEDPIELNGYVALMEERANALAVFVSNLIDSVKNSDREINSASIDIAQFVAEIVQLHLPNPNHLNIEFHQEIEPEFQVKTDRLLLTSVLNNLVSNAIKYRDETKDRSIIKISVLSTQENWTIVVEDNGVGISEEHQSKVFDIFYRTNESNRAGSGLGLHIVKEAVIKLQGIIVLSSAPGCGTEFRLTLPREPRLDPPEIL